MKKIYLCTDNENKVQIWRDDLKNYSFQVVGVKKDLSDAEIHEILSRKDTLCIAREETNLYSEQQLSERNSGTFADNICHITVTFLENGAVHFKKYDDKIHGFIFYDESFLKALAKDGKEISTIWWDEIFYPEFADYSKNYKQLRKEGSLKSARELAISFLANDRFRLTKTRVSYQPESDKILFDQDIAENILADETLKAAEGTTIYNLIIEVFNQGVFFRPIVTQRDRNYWYPPFSGIPITPKRDNVHEMTYLVHDLFHQLFPDGLINFDNSNRHRIPYLINRLMSEAFTLVLADMIFVDSIQSLNYDFSKRKIYPLFKKTGLDSTVAEDIKKLLFANARFFIFGDISEFQKLVGECAELDEFVEKYTPFAREDLKWSSQNYQNFQAHPATDYNEWAKYVQKIFPEMSGFSEKKSTEEIFSKVFNTNWTKIENVLCADQKRELADWKVRRSRGFKKLFAGNLGLWLAYSPLKNSAMFDYVFSTLQKNVLDIEEINQIVTVYERSLTFLRQTNRIDHNDFLTMKIIFPLFKPHFVFYDLEETRDNWAELRNEVFEK